MRLSVPLLAVLATLGGCTALEKQGYVGPARSDAEVALLVSVGDVGFRIDRTVDNQRPTAFLMKVNGYEVATGSYGFPLKTKVLPGTASLEMYCALPNSVWDGKPPPARGLGAHYTYSVHTIPVQLDAGKQYALRCEPTSHGRVRFWVEQYRGGDV